MLIMPNTRNENIPEQSVKFVYDILFNNLELTNHGMTEQNVKFCREL